MLLYIDDDSVDRALIRQLMSAGHDTLAPRVAGTAGKADAAHLMYAIGSQRVLVTRNHEDFMLLHDLIMLAGGHHPGIFVVRLDNDPKRNMSPGAIVRAIEKLIASNIPVGDSYHVLNHWR
jgi:predicted nuclease of predicted toxin-antitoxin system